MHPIIFEPCNDSLIDFESEDSITSIWSDTPPIVGDLISMGGEERWKIIEVFPFQPAKLGEPIQVVYLAFVHPQNPPAPSRDKWTCEQFKPDHSDVAVNLYLVNESIEIHYDMRGFPPMLGKQLQDYEQIENTTAMRGIPRPWYVDDVSLFLTLSAAPYSKVHLCRCSQGVLAA